jgi:hypothetical protein
MHEHAHLEQGFK